MNQTQAQPRLIYELDLWCVICRRHLGGYVSWKSPKVGDRTYYCTCNSHDRIGIVDSVVWESEISDRKQIEEWVDRVYWSPDIEHDDAYEIFAPHCPDLVKKVIQKKVWIYPVGALSSVAKAGHSPLPL